jgi:outer membrane protein OmpA-like peptidoglycan-associated protein
MMIQNAVRNAALPALLLFSTLVTPACATTTPIELIDARAAYARASAGPAAQWTPADLHKAQVALQEAEQTFTAEQSSQKTIDLAYIAERTAQIAEARAVSAMAEKRTSQATQALGDKQAQIATQTRGDLVKTRDQLAEAQRGQAQQAQDATVDRTARQEADKNAAASEQKAAASEQKAALSEQNARDANAALAKLAAKEDERGTVITLSGSVLFRSSESELLPASLTRLDEVAAALVAKGQDVVIEGHTDSKGAASSNMTLSRLRAESVRSYLVSRGVPMEKIVARGMGSDRPIASNTSTEGRANNRRVEIVIAKSAPRLN